MQLGQERRAGERGYAMVGLLVAIALMSLSLSIALPVWRTQALREKEEELLWRGQQYARAILLYQRKTAAPGPPSIDLLVEQRFLRRKYKDPITNGEFEYVAVGTPGTGAAPGAPRTPGAPNRQTGRDDDEEENEDQDEDDGIMRNADSPRMPGRGFGQLIGGVRSKSRKKSLKVVNGRSIYNEWEFVYEPYRAGPQPTAPGTGSGPRTGQPSPGRPGAGFERGSSGSGRTLRRMSPPQ